MEIGNTKNNWTPRSWIIPPGLSGLLERFDIRSEILIDRHKNGDSRPLLIRGATGVGKSLFAEFFIHKFLGTPISLNENNLEPFQSGSVKRSSSYRSSLPQVKFVNCAALSETLLESELFGHVKGAFTGASGNKIGWLETVKDGVLVLEEVGEMSKSLQTKLLIAVENRRFQKVGDTKDIKLQAQLIATSNVDRDKFRDDFWYRFEVFSVPSICERREDVLYYMEHFDPELMKILTKGAIFSALCYHWPGNVREIQRVCSAIREEIIYHQRVAARAQGSVQLNGDEYSASPAWHPFDYQGKDVSEYRFNRASQFAVEMLDDGINVNKIEKALHYNGLSFDSFKPSHRSRYSDISKRHTVASSDGFEIVFIFEMKYRLMYSGVCVFCKFFMQDISSSHDLFDLSSVKFVKKDFREFDCIDFIFEFESPFLFVSKQMSSTIEKKGGGAAFFSAYCREFYDSNLPNLSTVPDEYKKAMVESLKFATGIKNIVFDDILDIKSLYKRNSDNAFLAAYFGEEVGSLFEQIPIEDVALDDLRSLYYETVCSQIGVARGYQDKLAKISHRNKATISNDLKKMNLKRKFEKPNFIPQKRLIILKE